MVGMCYVGKPEVALAATHHSPERARLPLLQNMRCEGIYSSYPMALPFRAQSGVQIEGKKSQTAASGVISQWKDVLDQSDSLSWIFETGNRSENAQHVYWGRSWGSFRCYEELWAGIRRKQINSERKMKQTKTISSYEPPFLSQVWSNTSCCSLCLLSYTLSFFLPIASHLCLNTPRRSDQSFAIRADGNTPFQFPCPPPHPPPSGIRFTKDPLTILSHAGIMTKAFLCHLKMARQK